MITILIVSICIISACSTNPVPKTEFEFANKLAQDDLWKEAYYRWSKLLEQGKESPALYNNIAVAHEKMGQLEEADKAYQKALKFGAQKINLHRAGAEFRPCAGQPTAGSADLCFIAETPVEKLRERLLQCGVAIEDGPVQRTGASGPILSIYIRDPDQNLIELSNYL